MNLIKEERGAALIIRVVGQLTVTDRAELETMVGHAIDAGQRRIVLDFSATPYIDSSGLAALAAMARRMRAAAGELHAAALDDDLRALMELTKLDAILPLAATTDEAVARL
jgi:anti-sigma B factor antagonist